MWWILSWLTLRFVKPLLGSLSNDDGDVNENDIKADKMAKQQLCACVTCFCTFLCRHCTTTRWKSLISRFVKDVNTRQRLSFSFLGLRYTLLEFNSRKNCKDLTNWMRQNKRNKVWNSATSLFKWRFRSRRHRCCLSSLLKGQPALSGQLAFPKGWPA